MQDKEDLYDDKHKLKIQVNQLKTENQKLRCQLQSLIQDAKKFEDLVIQEEGFEITDL